MLELKQGAYTLDEYIDLHEAMLVMYLQEKEEERKNAAR